MAPEPNPVHPRYRPLLESVRERPAAPEAKSETQAQLLQMDPAARAALEAAQRSYLAGGNQPGSTGPENAGMRVASENP